MAPLYVKEKVLRGAPGGAHSMLEHTNSRSTAARSLWGEVERSGLSGRSAQQLVDQNVDQDHNTIVHCAPLLGDHSGGTRSSPYLV
jgi:hypothetical protein